MSLLEIRTGYLSLGGKLAKEGTTYDGESEIDIVFADGNDPKPIRWVWARDLWIARDLVLMDVTWDQLNKFGMVKGKEIDIAGLKYQVRCPQLGAEDDLPNERDAILEEAGKQDKFCFSLEGRFWGLDTCPDGKHPLRVGHWVSRNGNLKANFRPVLKPITIAPVHCRTGATIFAFVRNGDGVAGILETVSDYDLVLSKISAKRSGREPERLVFRELPDNRVIVDRAQVLYIQETSLD